MNTLTAREDPPAPPSIGLALVRDEPGSSRFDCGRIEKLTERQREILLMIARGMSNAEIARTLYLGTETVKTHVGNVLGKLALRDRVHATIFAYETGLVGHSHEQS